MMPFASPMMIKSNDVSAANMPHRYWRIFVVDQNGGGHTAIGRVEFYSSALDGPKRLNRAIGGTASASGANSGETADKAFDGTDNGQWAYNVTTNTWLAYDFGAGNEKIIDRFSIRARSSSSDTTVANQTPKNFRLEFSDDNSTWFTAYTPSAQTGWDKGEQRLFTLPSYSQSYSGSPHGTHRYWRIHMGSDNNGTATTFSAAEVEFRSTPGGSDITGSGTPAAHSEFSPPTYNAAKAFDNNTGTLWSANGATSDGWLSYDFGSAVSVAQVYVTARNDASYFQTPRFGSVEWSDDNAVWNTAWEYTVSAFTTGASRTSTDPAYV